MKSSKNIYRLPFDEKLDIRPSPAPFHYKDNGLENAVDFAMPEGTPILAAFDGIVEEVVDKYYTGKYEKSFLNKCNFIIIKHANGECSNYVHLKKGCIVKERERVNKGQLIGYSGLSGFTSYPHLHFEVSADYSALRSIPIRFKIKDKIVILSSPR
ncbi:M23 family metallopeptidase [Candidatus Woesearchaeota archaeon]|nr:M23 family metallopeptidase [Candidatus Woesearchaeota archaeon]